MAETVDQLFQLVGELRKKCPWDRVQTLQSLKNSLVEETHELRDAIEADDCERIREELGDLLALILMTAEIAGEKRLFTLQDVVTRTSEKMKMRHPHVFGSEKLESPEEVEACWEKSKLKETGSILDSIPKSLPALLLADTIQRRAARVGFDWERLEDVFEKVEEELGELREVGTETCQDDRLDEFGDLLFSVVNLSRFLKVDAEEALRHTVEKFTRRFGTVEAELRKRGKSPEETTLGEMDRLWNEAKTGEKNG
jgi:XTP/dITP diphosphohydrolase